MAEVINQYLTDGLTSFNFDDALSEIRENQGQDRQACRRPALV
jgi:hypothetical protein